MWIALGIWSQISPARIMSRRARKFPEIRSKCSSRNRKSSDSNNFMQRPKRWNRLPFLEAATSWRSLKIKDQPPGPSDSPEARKWESCSNKITLRNQSDFKVMPLDYNYTKEDHPSPTHRKRK